MAGRTQAAQRNENGIPDTTGLDLWRMALEGEDRGLRLLRAVMSGSLYVTSSRPHPDGLEGLYLVDPIYGCDCEGFERNGHCTHFGLVLNWLGWLPDVEDMGRCRGERVASAERNWERWEKERRRSPDLVEAFEDAVAAALAEAAPAALPSDQPDPWAEYAPAGPPDTAPCPDCRQRRDLRRWASGDHATWAFQRCERCGDSGKLPAWVSLQVHDGVEYRVTVLADRDAEGFEGLTPDGLAYCIVELKRAGTFAGTISAAAAFEANDRGAILAAGGDIEDGE